MSRYGLRPRAARAPLDGTSGSTSLGRRVTLRPRRTVAAALAQEVPSDEGFDRRRDDNMHDGRDDSDGDSEDNDLDRIQGDGEMTLVRGPRTFIMKGLPQIHWEHVPHDLVCIICQEGFHTATASREAPPYRLGCHNDHVLHEDCLARMLEFGEQYSRGKCPYCRWDFAERVLHDDQLTTDEDFAISMKFWPEFNEWEWEQMPEELQAMLPRH